LRTVNAKLYNQKFVANAKPEIVESGKKSDAEAKITTIAERISELKNNL